MFPEKRKLPPMGFRPTLEMRTRLERAARQSGKSLTNEIERRPEKSFLMDDIERYLKSLK